MQIKCGCKINLRLKILNQREDGYHNIETIFYPLPYPFDLINILSFSESKNKDVGAIKVYCNKDGIDLRENTLTKAYKVYRDFSGYAPNLELELIKNIPHGAGLGGGSSNAAGLLLYLQTKNPNPITFEDLIGLASKVGADVPFFLYNTPCKARGIGEILDRIELNLEKFYLLLINPYIQISTKLAFNKLSEQKKYLTIKQGLDITHSSQFLQDFFCENDFEQVIFESYPTIGTIKNKLLEAGAKVALLSGSGSCLFGIFESLELATQCKKTLIDFFGSEELEIYPPLKLK